MLTSEIKGGKDFDRKLRAVAEAIERGAESGSREEVSETADDMRKSVPVFEGHLQAGIQEEFKGTQGRVVSTDEASEHVEHGTSSMEAQPFAQPAADRARARYAQRMVKHVKNEIERAAK